MLFIFSIYLFVFRGFTRIVQPWSHEYVIWASKKLFSQALRFHSFPLLHDDLYRLLIVSSEDYSVPGMLFVL